MKGTIQRRSTCIGLTYRVWIKTFASSYFLQMLFWVDITISSQSSFDKIVTSYFRPSLRRPRRDKNWLHIKDRSLIQLSRSPTFSRTLSLNNFFMYVVVGPPLAAPLMCWHPRYQLDSSHYAKHVQIEGPAIRVPQSQIFVKSRDPAGHFRHPASRACMLSIPHLAPIFSLKKRNPAF